MLPSELLARKQFFFQCGEENTTERDVELLGDDCLLWASDFPHADHTPEYVHDLNELVGAFPEDQRRAFIGDNARALFKL